MPVKLFKHRSQSFYSKPKGGVDRSAHQRAMLLGKLPYTPNRVKVGLAIERARDARLARARTYRSVELAERDGRHGW